MKTYADLVLDCFRDLEAQSGVPDLVERYQDLRRRGLSPIPDEILARPISDEAYELQKIRVAQELNPRLARALQEIYLSQQSLQVPSVSNN